VGLLRVAKPESAVVRILRAQSATREVGMSERMLGPVIQSLGYGTVGDSEKVRASDDRDPARAADDPACCSSCAPDGGLSADDDANPVVTGSAILDLAESNGPRQSGRGPPTPPAPAR
jgi:hypothetical protein